MNVLKRWSASLLLALVVQGAGGAGAAETVRINGSGAALDMMKPVVKAFAKRNPGIRIEMEKPLGSSGAIKALLAGALDLAVSSKPVKPEEAAAGAISREYGRMPLVIVTNRDVRRNDITTDELENIFAGKTRKWADGGAVRVVLRPDADIDTVILRRLSPRMNDAVTEAHRQPGMLMAVTDPESTDLIANTPGAIGASGLSGVLAALRPLNMLTLNGIPATTATLRTGQYPLAKDVRFLTRKDVSPGVQKLLAFVYSAEGRALAEKAGVVTSGAKPGP